VSDAEVVMSALKIVSKRSFLNVKDLQIPSAWSACLAEPAAATMSRWIRKKFIVHDVQEAQSFIFPESLKYSFPTCPRCTRVGLSESGWDAADFLD
jgi:hypothetical protein